jgi:subtilase family serine protease
VKFKAKTVAAAASCLLLYPAMCMTAAAAAQTPIAYSASAQDLGSAPADTVIDLAISLKLLNRPALEKFVADSVNPASRTYRRFMTPQQFAASYGQPAAVIARVKTYLESQGMTVTQVHANNLVLMVKATNAQAASVFNTTIHSFSENGVLSQRPLATPLVPADIADVVAGVHGLSTRPKARSRLKMNPVDADQVQTKAGVRTLQPQALPASKAGQYSTKDFVKLYNVTPLQTRGITGAGKTLGILTFASFANSDAVKYWTDLGLTASQTSASRITVVNVIPGSTIDTNGDDETTLDVEQSGGLAPDAAITVYEAPNTDAGFLALFSQAVSDNTCDSLSISWGSPEWYNSTDDLAPYDAVLLQAAAQGIPISAASGDEGAYDIGAIQVYPYYSNVLAVDFPSSSPYIVAAGGTTLPVTITKTNPTFSYTVTAEQPWAWDYLLPYYAAKTGGNGTQSTYYKSYFPVGGGGGVSVLYPLPSYQQGLPGVQTSAAGQAEICFTSQPAIGSNAANPCTPGPTSTFSDGSFFPGGALLPAGFAGRNTPDVSLNADTYSGYVLYYKGAYYTQGGGTSFVAPQLNGIFTLLTQAAGHRIGWPHPQLYSLFKTVGYGTGSPFRAITKGSNLYYTAAPQFNPATGIGSLDVGNLANFLAPAAPAAAPSAK